MPPRLAISVSYYGRHRKGDGQVMDAGEHKDMLAKTLRYLKKEMASHSPLIVVCASGHNPVQGWPLDIPMGVQFVTTADQTGNPDGSWWALCHGVRFAVENDCEYLIHQCEDCLPHRGVMADMLYRLHTERLDYLGHLWRPNGELATQFFGCRVNFLNDCLKQPILGSVLSNPHTGPELKLGMIFGTYGVNDYVLGTRRNVGIMPQSYEHTHSYDVFLKLLEGLKK